MIVERAEGFHRRSRIIVTLVSVLVVLIITWSCLGVFSRTNGYIGVSMDIAELGVFKSPSECIISLLIGYAAFIGVLIALFYMRRINWRLYLTLAVVPTLIALDQYRTWDRWSSRIVSALEECELVVETDFDPRRVERDAECNYACAVMWYRDRHIVAIYPTFRHRVLETEEKLRNKGYEVRRKRAPERPLWVREDPRPKELRSSSQ